MFLLKIHNQGSINKITGYRTQPDNVRFAPHQFMRVDESVYAFVVENFETFEMSYPDTLTNISIGMIEKKEITDINEFKNTAQHLFRTRHTDKHLGTDFHITNAAFIFMNNRLQVKGYAFTPENREHLYLEILNTADHELITMLEEYLILLDYMVEHEAFINEYLAVKREILACKTVQEVREVYNKYTGENLQDVMHPEHIDGFDSKN